MILFREKRLIDRLICPSSDNDYLWNGSVRLLLYVSHIEKLYLYINSLMVYPFQYKIFVWRSFIQKIYLMESKTVILLHIYVTKMSSCRCQISYMSKCGGYIISPLNVNPTKWSNKGSNILRQFVGRNWRIVWVCLSDHFVGFTPEGLTCN